MAGFKVGDRVKLTTGTAMSAHSGATAVVTALGPRESYPSDLKDIIQVKWDRDDLSGNQMDGGYREAMFELIPEANPLADLNVGDKFTLEYEVIQVADNEYSVHPKGAEKDIRRFIPSNARYEPESVVRKPVEPAPGQLWKCGPHIRRIVAIDSGIVFYMSEREAMRPNPFWLSVENFKNRSTYVGPAES